MIAPVRFRFQRLDARSSQPRLTTDGVRDGTVSLWWAYRDAHKENLAKVASVWKDRPLPDFGNER
jgi:hypothetical protein